MEFQNKYFNYIHDGDGEGLLSDGRKQSLVDWILDKNFAMRKGSVLVCDTAAMTFPEVAAGCYRYKWNGSSDNNYTQIREPVDNFTVAICQKNSKGQFFVKLPCTNYTTAYKESTIKNVVFFLPEGRTSGYSKRSYSKNSTLYLVLDNVSIEELEYFCGQRRFRNEYLSYMSLFKTAKTYLLKAKEDDLNNVNMYEKIARTFDHDLNLRDYQLSSLVNCTALFFKTSNSDQHISSYLNLKINKESQQRTKAAIMQLFKKRVHGDLTLPDATKPIVATMDDKGCVFVYANIPENEQLNQVTPNVWLNRYSVIPKRWGNSLVLTEENTRITLDKYRRDERVCSVINDDVYNEYIKKTSWSSQKISHPSGVEFSQNGLFDSYDCKKAMLETEQYSIDLLRKIVTNSLTRQDVEYLYSFMFEGKGQLALFIGVIGGYRCLFMSIYQAKAWITALYAKYQEQPTLDLIEQDNSSVRFNVKDENWPKSWNRDDIFASFKLSKYWLNEDMGFDANFSKLLQYSDHSVGFACSMHHSIIYSQLISHTGETTTAIDEWLGSKIVAQPVIKIGILECYYRVRLKGSYDDLVYYQFCIVSDLNKLPDLEEAIKAKFEILSSMRDLQKETVQSSTIIRKEFVIHHEDYRWLLPRNNREDVIWSKTYNCYITKDHEHFLGK